MDLTKYQFAIPGVPMPLARPRFQRRGRFVHTYNPQAEAVEAFRSELRIVLPECFAPNLGPLRAFLLFVMPVPKSISAKKRDRMLSGDIRHAGRPDLDNLIKFVLDAANGLLFLDDSQIFEIFAQKRYGAAPCTMIGFEDTTRPPADPGAGFIV